MAPELTREQRAAVERREGSLMVRAGAGAGKTSVLVERFARAVTEDGVAVDAILAITFTEKAAAELRERVRRRLVELGRREEARDAEQAWISTIHGFCARLLRAHALSAGVDPELRVLDGLEAERLGLDAFDRALEAFLGDAADPRRLEMVASYTPDKVREMVRTAYSRLRSRGERRPELEPVPEPRPDGEHERLCAAAAAALADLGAAGDGKQVRQAVDALERCAALLDRAGPEHPADPAELGPLKLRGTAKALSSAACEGYRQAYDAYHQLCSERRQYLDRTLLRELLALYGERYEGLKRGRSGLDFEDLELIARDLLAADAGLREQYSERFVHVLVDEFQDTNPLQNELLELLARDNLFRVGDENQSIYGFRHADVGVFRTHHAEAAELGRALSVTTNFRSRGELLDAVDLAFAGLWGDDFEPLRERPDARAEGPRVDPCVELLVVDKRKDRWDERFPAEADPEPFGPTMRAITPWRACEARLLARRIDELTADGLYGYGEVVVLMRATTHMGCFERALEERGIPTHVVGGRGYWSQAQVGDLRHWLAALANPLDELSVYSVLASPLVGASLDTVTLIGLESRRRGRDAWWTLREPEGALDALPVAERRRLESFVDRLEGQRRIAPTVSLETLIDRAIAATGYDRHVLSLPAGERRMANVRKLMRMAREFEAEEGRDLRRFIDFVGERDLIAERQGEAPLEAEDLDAVRLMTVHRAKGLEFPVVCVADLGKDGREDHGALRISDDGRVGLRLASMGGASVDTAELERIKAEQRELDEAEERRIAYVAATRAQEHLVLSGATDLEALPEPKPLREPMSWIWRGFVPDLPREGAAGIATAEFEGRPVRVRFERCAPATVDELLPDPDRRPARPEPPAEPGFEQPPLDLAALPAPRALPVSRLSYSGLAAYDRCSYRFYLERVLGLPSGDAPAEPADEPPPDELHPLLRGSLVHQLLERLDFARPQVPGEEEVGALIERHGEPVRAAEVEDLRGMVAAFAGSELCSRLGRAHRVSVELPFAFALKPPTAGGRSVLINGFVDVIAEEDDGGGALIVDYKSDRLDGREPAALVEEGYLTQRVVYALAALRGGFERVEVAHVLLERPGEPVSATYSAGDAGALERELLDLARGVVESRFEPALEPHRGLCAGCPGQAALCSWEPEQTMREPVAG